MAEEQQFSLPLPTSLEGVYRQSSVEAKLQFDRMLMDPVFQTFVINQITVAERQYLNVNVDQEPGILQAEIRAYRRRLDTFREMRDFITKRVREISADSLQTGDDQGEDK